MSLYFIHTASGQRGPISIDDVKNSGITKDTMVWKEGLTDWVKAGDLEELKTFFSASPSASKAQEITPSALTDNNLIKTGQQNKKSIMMLLSLAGIVIAVIGIVYFTTHKKPDKAEVKNIILAKTDTSSKKDTVVSDTIKKVSLDTLSSWMTTDTTSVTKTDTAHSDVSFLMGGILVKRNSGIKNQADVSKKINRKPISKVSTIQPDKPARVRSLQISGGFRKNLLLEAVLEGSVTNPNSSVSFRNTIITAVFLNDEGNSLGSKEFSQSGVLHAYQALSFKFKTYPPRGTKSVRYSVSGIPF